MGNRDHTIKTLQDEIAEQDEVINKLNKEKKHLSSTQAKSAEDLISAEEKVHHLNQVKSQLESTLDQLEGGLDKEKKGRASTEKQKRKIEGDLKMAQDTVNDLERERRDIENTIANKEKNVHMQSAKLDDEQSLVAKAQKNIKELQARVEGAEEELEAERQARSKAERQRSDLAREIEQLGDRYDEASGATVAQVELNKKRESEIIKLRKDVEEANIASESVLTNLKRKQGDSVLEMQEQTDALQKMKAKIDKDKQIIMAEIADARAATDEVGRSQASADKSNKNLLETLNAINKKLAARNTEAEAAIDNLNAKLAQVEKAKSKIQQEINEMTTNLDQAQVVNAAMERKAKQFDKTISEYKGKVDRLSFDLDVSQKETRNASPELFKVKSAYEETVLQLEEVRRENKTLSNE